MRRLGIFVFYDKQGIAGKYVEYLLTQIKNNVDDLFIVSNCILVKASKELFLTYTNNIIERENYGFDGGAYRDVLCNVIGLNNCKKWDELLLINDTFYGPFCPLSNIFKRMENSPCDFWGLSIHGDNKGNVKRIISRHLQSYFLVIRSEMLKSSYFSEFWLKMKDIDSFIDAVDNFEIEFTQFFSKYGFSYETFIDTTTFEYGYEEKGINWTELMPYDLLINKGFPILKRKSLVSRSFFQTNALKILRYISDTTDYNIQMIWQDLLRRYDAYQLIFEMNLFYILNSGDTQDISVHDSTKTVVIFRIDTLTRLEDIISYVNQIDKTIKMYLWIENFDLFQSIKERYKEVEICYFKNKEEILLFWKNISKRFECIGYIYLKAAAEENYFSNYLILDNIQKNLIINSQIIYRICKLMTEEMELGLLLPPLDRYGNCNYIWGEDAFWIKGTCLNDICKNKKGQWLPDQVRKLGYYPAIVETNEYANMEVLRFNQMIFEEKKGYFFQTSQGYFQEFWFKYTKRYIYGAGKVAEKVTKFLYQRGWAQYEGYIVTKKENEDQLYYGKKVWQLDEVLEDEIGIVIALNEQNTKEVLSLLNNRRNIHCFILRGMEF